MKHHCKYVSKRLALLLMVLFAGTFTLTGCGSGGGSDDYDAPEGQPTTVLPSQVDNVLIDAKTLKGWIDAGLLKKDSVENVVILQKGDYLEGHVPGALEWAGSGIDRMEGPILSGNMVYDGETMDNMLNTLGIQRGSTVVFMGNDTERLYFMFRYWGFPKDQLKVLNGGTGAWAAEPDLSLTTALTKPTPNPEGNKISISDFAEGSLNDGLRASLSEMIDGVSNETVVPFATFARTLDMQTARITGTLDGSNDWNLEASGNVLFQGQMLGQVQDEELYADYLEFDVEEQEKFDNYWDTDYNLAANLYNPDGTYLSASAMRTYLKGVLGDANWEAVQKGGTKSIATFCRAGNLAATGFTPIDVVLGTEINVMLYDGSWSQWGSLTNLSSAIPADTLWAVPNDENFDYTYWATDDLTDDGAGNDPQYNIDLTTDQDDDGDVDVADKKAFLEQPYFLSEEVDLEAIDADYRESGAKTAPTGVDTVPGGSGC